MISIYITIALGFAVKAMSPALSRVNHLRAKATAFEIMLTARTIVLVGEIVRLDVRTATVRTVK